MASSCLKGTRKLPPLSVRTILLSARKQEQFPSAKDIQNCLYVTLNVEPWETVQRKHLFRPYIGVLLVTCLGIRKFLAAHCENNSDIYRTSRDTRWMDGLTYKSKIISKLLNEWVINWWWYTHLYRICFNGMLSWGVYRLLIFFPQQNALFVFIIMHGQLFFFSPKEKYKLFQNLPLNCQIITKLFLSVSLLSSHWLLPSSYPPYQPLLLWDWEVIKSLRYNTAGHPSLRKAKSRSPWGASALVLNQLRTAFSILFRMQLYPVAWGRK